MASQLEFNYRINDATELRLIEPQDAEELNSLIERNRAHLKEYSAWVKDDHSIENTRSFIKRNLAQFARHEGFAIAIWHKGEMAGQIEYNYIDWANRKTELGFWLGAGFQGKGLATESCRFLIHHAFNELRLNRIEMRCGVENSAALLGQSACKTSATNLSSSATSWTAMQVFQSASTTTNRLS